MPASTDSVIRSSTVGSEATIVSRRPRTRMSIANGMLTYAIAARISPTTAAIPSESTPNTDRPTTRAYVVNGTTTFSPASSSGVSSRDQPAAASFSRSASAPCPRPPGAIRPIRRSHARGSFVRASSP